MVPVMAWELVVEDVEVDVVGFCLQHLQRLPCLQCLLGTRDAYLLLKIQAVTLSIASRSIQTASIQTASIQNLQQIHHRCDPVHPNKKSSQAPTLI
jgi:hypothetical protein